MDADWPAACRRAAAACETVLGEHRGIARRTAYEGRGEGGDWSLVIDRRCEDAVFAELDRLHGDGHEFTAVSEERGEVVFGSGSSRVRVVIDPIDGSLNARRTIPSFSLSIAVASGPAMADVEFGFVHDFGAGEEFSATRGGGARLDGAPIETFDPGHTELEVVALESAAPQWVAPAAEALSGRVYRLRALGSVALSLAYVAAGRFDGFISLRQCRSVDAAAGQLIAREAGPAVEFEGLGLEEAGLGIEARYRVIAARHPEGLEVLRRAQASVGESER